MSQPYHHTKYSTKSDGQALFPAVILIACLVWAHKAAMTKIEHIIPIILLTVAVIVGLVAITKFVIKIRKYRQLHSPTMTSIDNMTGLEFEKYVAKLLRAHGYKRVRVTEIYDLGIDIIAEKDDINWGIQVKRYSGLVKANAVRQVVTALRHYGCDRAIGITNNIFSQPARSLAESNGCVLMDRNKFLQWI